MASYAVLAQSNSTAEAEPPAHPPMALQTIMKDMSKNLQTITAAIATEDWEAVAQAALLVADHPQPPFTEKFRILSFIGSDVASFKAHDAQVHDAAVRLSEVAETKDGSAIIQAFSEVQQRCLACHDRFRQPFVEHFYQKHQ